VNTPANGLISGKQGGLRRVLTAAKPYQRDGWRGVALLPLLTALSLLQPYLLKIALDEDLETMAYAGAGIIALTLVSYLVFSVHSYLLQVVGHRALSDLRARLLEHLLSQGTSFFDRRPVGVLLSRVTSDSESVGQGFAFGLISIIADALLIFGTLVAMLLLDVKITLYTLLLAPPIVALVWVFKRALRGYADKIRRAAAQVNNVLEENLAGFHIVRWFGREAQSRREFEEHSQHYFSLYARFNIADAALYAVMDALSAVAIGGVLWAASGSVLQGSASVGLVVAFIQYVQRAFIPIREFSGKLAGLQSAMAGLDRMDTTLSMGEGRVFGSTPWLERTGAISFEHVRFRYRPEGPDLLKGIHLHVAPGEKVAVVGPTGSGKTTLLNLLTRHYVPNEGTVRLDGISLMDIEEESLRLGVGVVRQDVFMFEGTFAQNVSLDDPSITRARVEEAVRVVGLGPLIKSREGGLDAPVDEGGRNLSAGEAQLLSLARVFARNPSILLLDEATARIDSMTEVLVQDALEKLMAGRTTLVVAHRLSTIESADRILVLVDGEISEQGTHSELIDGGGLYSTMHHEKLFRLRANAHTVAPTSV